MLDLQTLVSTLKRPGLLVRAARFGLDDYRRDVHLRRILKTEPLPRTGAALMRLMDKEAELNDMRRAKSAEYNPTLHISVLTAIMGEARILQATSGKTPT